MEEPELEPLEKAIQTAHSNFFVEEELRAQRGAAVAPVENHEILKETAGKCDHRFPANLVTNGESPAGWVIWPLWINSFEPQLNLGFVGCVLHFLLEARWWCPPLTAVTDDSQLLVKNRCQLTILDDGLSVMMDRHWRCFVNIWRLSAIAHYHRWRTSIVIWIIWPSVSTTPKQYWSWHTFTVAWLLPVSHKEIQHVWWSFTSPTTREQQLSVAAIRVSSITFSSLTKREHINYHHQRYHPFAITIVIVNKFTTYHHRRC